MMIRKVISGGQTGADQGALDAAIELGIPYGGWIPKGRLTEKGPLPDMYNMTEMSTGRYKTCAKQNVIDSCGTLVVSRGSENGDSAHTKRVAKKHQKPYFHINLESTATFFASSKIVKWAEENEIEVLNVTGPKASIDPFIHRDVKKIIIGVFYFSLFTPDLDFIQLPLFEEVKVDQANRPRTVKEAVHNTIDGMSLKEKVTVANLTEKDLIILEGILVFYVSMLLEEWTVNEELLESCMGFTGIDMDAASASTVILEEIWKELKVTHRLRIIE